MPSGAALAVTSVGVGGTGRGCHVTMLDNAEGVPSLRRDRTAYHTDGGEVPAG